MNNPDWNLLRVNFRPTQNRILLNNKRDGSWTAEPGVSLSYSQELYALEKVLEVRIIVGRENYHVLLNGEELGTFPQRDELSNAKYVSLWAESAFQWTAVELPRSTETIGIEPTLGERYHFKRLAATGDIITASGIYATGTDDFIVNLQNDYGFLRQLTFHPSVEDNLIVVSMHESTDGDADIWTRHLNESIPLLENGQAFRVEIRCQLTELHVYVNRNKLCLLYTSPSPRD